MINLSNQTFRYIGQCVICGTITKFEQHELEALKIPILHEIIMKCPCCTRNMICFVSSSLEAHTLISRLEFLELFKN